MKPRQLQTFLAVAEVASIRAAARGLGVSQPAVTKAMRELERELEAPLFERHVKGVRLTECGQAFVPRARLLLEDMRRAREEIAQLRDGAGGRVNVSVSTAVAHSLLPAAFKAWRAALPTADVRFGEGVLPVLLAGLRDGSLDFAVAHVSEGELPEDIEAMALHAVRLVVAARQQHPLARCRRLSQLRDAEWLLPTRPEAGERLIEGMFAACGLAMPARTTHGQSVTVALALVGRSDVIGLFVDTLLPVFRHHRIRQIDVRDPLPQLHVCAIRRRGARLTPAAQQLFEGFRQAAAAFHR